MQLKVSLIINIHNSSDYVENISNTINSLSNKIEIILVDDCSTDKSCEKISNLTKNSSYKFIKLKVPSGISKSRNIGIENATREFISFMDHDDSINNNEFIKSSSKVNHLDENSLIVCPYTTSFYKDNLIITDRLISKEREINTNNLTNINYRFSSFSNSRETYHICLSAWSKFYSMKIIKSKSLKFKEGMDKFEDCSFGLSYLYSVKKIYILENNFYTYSQARFKPSGLTNKYNIHNWLGWIDELNNELNFQKINNKKISIQFLSIFLIGTIIRYLNICRLSKINLLTQEINKMKINHRHLLKMHTRPPGADFFLTLILRYQLFTFAWIYCRLKRALKSKKYTPPLWCISEKADEL